jgi:hypothetical protein
LRWAAFEERLSADQLRAYLKRLPDFDDVEAEERAMNHALGFRSFAALGFFTEWPDPARAAQLVLARASEIDGNLYYLLDPTARLIEGKHPLAATLLRRAMIEDTLDGAKSTRSGGLHNGAPGHASYNGVRRTHCLAPKPPQAQRRPRAPKPSRR